MAEDSFRRFYLRADFVALIGNQIPLPLLQTALLVLNPSLSQPIIDVRELPGEAGAVLEWRARPTDADLVLVNNLIAAFTGGTTTSQPFEYNSFAAATSTSATPVVKIDQTTPALDAGTYQVIWTSSTRMLAVAANTGVQADVTFTRSDGVSVHQDDAWDLANRHAFNGALTFQVLAGQTIRSQLTFNRLGASGTAEMSGARITVDKIS